MKNLLRTPLYWLWVLLACGYLTAANTRGWSILQSLAFGSLGAAHGAPIRHK